MTQRDLEAELDAVRARQAQLERCLAALQVAVTEITDELDPIDRGVRSCTDVR
jgi:hypothetical protein